MEGGLAMMGREDVIDVLKRRRLLLAAGASLLLLLVAWRCGFNSRAGRVKPKVGPIVEAIYALGTVKTDNNYNLRVTVNSVISRMYVVEGQLVPRGAPLIMTDFGLILRAPFAGTVTRKYFEEGEIIIPGQTVLTLMDLTHTYVQVSLDQQSALRVKRGQNVELSFESIRSQKMKGRVELIYPSTGQFLARISVPGLPGEILPEMTADVAIEVERRDQALLIPMAAVRRGTVTYFRDGRKSSTMVKIGAVNGEWGEVLDKTILPGDEIMIPDKGSE
jgi:multidrug efflux pump subunit AcrA (membrane-fusion protein)